MKLRLSIHYKIVLTLTIIVAVILSGIYFYLNKNLKESTYQRIRAGLSKESDLAQLYVEEVFSHGFSAERTDIIADQIGARLGLRATIIGPDGKVLGDSEVNTADLKTVENHLSRPEVQGALKYGFGESRRFSTTVRQDMLYMARPFDAGSQRGFIRLALPLSEIRVVSENLKHLLFAAVFYALLLAVILGLSVFNFISRPIREVACVAREIATGNYAKRACVSTGDELGELARSINNISEHIKTRIEEITANKSRFETVLLSMVEGTMVVDKNGTIMLMNQVSKRFFRVDMDPVGKKPLEIIRNIEIQETVDHVLHSGESMAFQEITILLPEEKTLQVHAAPVLRESEIDGAVLVFHDITDLKRLENVRRDFVANVSHEIKTPLTSIKGYTETLLDGAMDDKDNAKDFLKIIGSDADRLVCLVDDLLDLSRIESGKLDLQLASRSFEDAVDRVIAGFKKRSEDQGVTIVKKIPNGLPFAYMDEKAIAQVLLNLINNAVKYNREEGLVTISAEEKDGYILVHVADTGIGIPEDDLSRIFERFYRVDKARSRQMGGTGLGLAIVKHIVQVHGGEVFVKSQLGVGSTFSFTLPKA